MPRGELRTVGRPRWWKGIPQVSTYVREFWTRLPYESAETFVVVSGEWEQRLRAELRPWVEVAPDAIAVGPASKWTRSQADVVQMLVEEDSRRCVWLVVDGGTDFVADICEAYDVVTPVADLSAELPYPFDPALEAAFRARSRAFVFAPTGEEPSLLVAT